jgi:tRNA U34 5-carboxymethylaminomethyl modifying GTPase MnmE/TrmE
MEFFKKLTPHQKKELAEKVKKTIEGERSKPFTVSVMGQTGVGKSSLINALFGTNLMTDPAKPCTKKIEQIIIKGSNNAELLFYDLPGIGESDDKANEEYIEQYRKKIIDSDVVIWAFHADSRSIAFDLNVLRKVIDAPDAEKAILFSKITFILTKTDLLTQSPWGYAKDDQNGFFFPTDSVNQIIQLKTKYYEQEFINAHGNFMISQTYNDGSFDIKDIPSIEYNKYQIRYKGLLTEEKLSELQTQYPKHRELFQRIFDNYKIIPCSSLFRYNLSNLMLAITNKLGPGAMLRFKNFRNKNLDSVPVKDVGSFCNLLILDQKTKKIIFDPKNLLASEVC